MQSSAIATTFLPLALAVIMLGLGLSLQVSDFTRIVKFPKAVLVGLSCQMLLMPVICFFIAKTFALPPELAVGLMLLSASPGGAVANLYSHLSKGDVALNVSLTAINSLLSLLTLPLIVNFSLDYFMQEGQYIPMQFKKVIEVFLIVLVPVTIGMVINKLFPKVSQALSKPVKIASAVLLATVIVLAVGKDKDNLGAYFLLIAPAALAFNVLSMMAGYFIPRLVHLSKKEAIAIGMEIGIHNGTIAIYLALNVLANPLMAMPPAIYSLIMFFTAAAFGVLVNLKKEKE
ncbi:MAG: bile acid:sodium symporter family protein [Chitinophagales bacterium]|nr:bile acid:sodium symporter family protein [Chitinophagales bacterium]